MAPQIKVYETQTSAANVPEVQQASPQQFGSAGQGMQDLANSGFAIAKAIQRRREQAEVSDLHVNLSKAQSDFTQKFQDDLQKGTLNTEDFSKDFADHMDELQQNVSTRAGRLYFDQASAQLKAHFMDKAAVGQAELAGAQAKVNYMDSLNNGSSTLINDPSSFDTINEMQQQGIENLVQTGGLPAKAAGELKLHSQTELAKSAVRGWIKLDPLEAKKQLEDGHWDSMFDGDVKHQMLGEAHQAENALRVEDERIKKQAADAAAARQEETVQGFLSKMNDTSGPGLSTKDVISSMQAGQIDSSTAEHYIKAIDNFNQDRKAKSDPVVMRDLTRRLTLPDGNAEKITDMAPINEALSKGDLSIPDSNLLMGLLGEKHTPQGEADAALQQSYFKQKENETMKGIPGVPDPEGWAMYRQVQAQSLEYALNAAKNGKTKTQIWSPTIGGKENPDYVGNHVSTPRRSIEDVMQSTIDRLGVTPIQPPDTTKMVLPDGTKQFIPNKNVDKAIKRGAKKADK